jgi:hypothetical protein
MLLLLLLLGVRACVCMPIGNGWQYVARTQQGRLPQVQAPVRFPWSSTLKMDASTRCGHAPSPLQSPGPRTDALLPA